MIEIIADYGPRAVVFLFATLATLLTFVYGRGYIKAGWAQRLISRALREIEDAVLEVAQTYSDIIKAGASDGSLNGEERLEAKRRAIAVAKSNIGKKGLARLARVAGIDALDGWLDSKVESSVRLLKALDDAPGKPIGRSIKVVPPQIPDPS